MKALWLLPIAVGVVLVARQCRPKMGGFCARMFERMSDDFPPKQMHPNILAIRDQTERILGLLEGKAQAGG